MPQKPLKVNKKKQIPANRHGKVAKTKKGRFDVKPKRTTLKKKADEDRELTKAINAENEMTAAGVAANAGGKLSILKPPPVAMTKNDLKAKGKKGMPWGASTQ